MSNVLVIDDSQSLRATVVFTLTKSNRFFQVTEASSGEDALKLIEERRLLGLKPYDLLLVDVNMPAGMDGFQTVEKVRGFVEYHTTPILFLTADNSTDGRQHGKEVMATGWITKPFRPEVLLTTIERVIPA